MTTELYRLVQTWFTSRMPATKTRESIYDKAQRILSDPARVRTSENASPPDYWTGNVVGDHGTYFVASMSSVFASLCGMRGARVACNCKRGRQAKLCSHMIVGEEMRRSGEDA